MNLRPFFVFSSLLFVTAVARKSSRLGYDCNVCQHGGSDVHLDTLHVCRRPAPPSPGHISCTYDDKHMKCKGECPSGYKFPDGRNSIEIQCSTKDAVWYPIRSFPDCLPPDYRPYDQPGDQSHDNLDDQSVTLSRCKRPTAPAFGSIRCSYDSENLICTAKCNQGYSFPDGRTEKQLQCNLVRASWYPHGNFPHCQLSRHVGGDDGESLSITVQRCRRPPSPAPGTVSCTYDASKMVCVGNCDSGYYFPNGRSEMTLQCNTRDAYWYPLEQFPKCVTYDGIHRQPTSNEGNDEKTIYAVTLIRCRKPEAPQAGSSYCRYDTVSMNCTGTCRAGYYFPNGKREMLLQCKTESAVWYPRADFPACSQFDNERYTDDSQQQTVNEYLAVTLSKCGRKEAPAGGYSSCKYDAFGMNCTGTCAKGYYFPGRRSEIILRCRTQNGYWYPRNEFPSCVRDENDRYTDESQQQALQVTLSRCGRKEAPAGGYVTCRYDAFGMNCTGTCATGYYFPENSAEIILQCRTENGYWYPRNEFPSCALYDNGGVQTVDNTDDDKSTYTATLIKCRKPVAPEFGVSFCKYDSVGMNCTGTCRTGYYFPNGKREMPLRCRTESGVWYPRADFPACSQFDSERYTGSDATQQQEQINKLLAVTLNKCGRKGPPSSGYVNCSYDVFGMNCTGTCRSGSYFPGRRAEITLRCRTENGYWYPENEFPACASHDGDRYTDESQQKTEDDSHFGVTLVKCRRREAPDAGSVNCRYDALGMNCTGTCSSGYYFPGGRREIILRCKTDRGYWYPMIQFPPCTSLENEKHTDDSQQRPQDVNSQLQITVMKCGRIETPHSGYVNCNYDTLGMNCTGTCESGYYFPGKRTEIILRCRTENGYWYPRNEFPACRSYENENVEESSSQTQVEEDKLIQETLVRCGRKNPPENGYVNCNYDSSIMNCTGRCMINYYFPKGLRQMVLQCNREYGRWYPENEFPKCRKFIHDDLEEKPKPENEDLRVTLDKCGMRKAPIAGYVNCKYDAVGMNCTATCSNGYYFPNGRTEMIIQCITSSRLWFPRSQFPKCSKDVTSYVDATVQPNQEGENSQFLETLRMCIRRTNPTSGYVYCTHDALGMNCTGRCRIGQHFPNGEKEIVLRCRTDNGLWYPQREFPICSPSTAANLHENQEKDHLVCQNLRSPSHGYISCSDDTWSKNKICVARCKLGYRFPNHQFEMTLTCSKEDGKWSPLQKFPACLSEAEEDKMENQNQLIQENLEDEVTGEKCGKPNPPITGYLSCLNYSHALECTGTCMPDYAFSNGITSMTLTCSFASGIWSPSNTFTPCYQKNQIPSISNEENEDTGNPTTNILCPKLSTPKGGYIHCEQPFSHGYRRCTGTCMTGFSFPNGENSMVLRCSIVRGWLPASSFPACKENKDRIYQPEPEIPTNNQGADLTGQSLISENQTPDRSEGIYGNTGNVDHGNTGTTRSFCRSPPSPKNGYVSCLPNVETLDCTARCSQGFHFPNGQNKLLYRCLSKSGRWSPSGYFPDCISACDVPCNNGGVCIGRNQCFCTQDYRGNFCQYPLSNCDPLHLKFAGSIRCNHTSDETVCQLGCPQRMILEPSYSTVRCNLEGIWSPRVSPRCIEDPRYKDVDSNGRLCPTSQCSSSSLTADEGGLCRRPPPPKPGYIRCIYNRLIMECTSKCADGYRYANGQTEQIRTCDNRTGIWTPSHYMSECQPVCERPCQNEGSCMAPNFCFCPVKYRGKFCQYPLSNCDPHRLRFAGSIRCSHSSEETVCKLGCPEGTVLDNPSLDTVRCSLEGYWTPQYVPRCIEANVGGRPTYSNQDYHQQSNYQQQYEQSQTNEHSMNYEQRMQRQAQNSQIRESSAENGGSAESQRINTDKEKFRDSELEKESYEQRLKMKQEEEQRKLYDRILRQSATNRTDQRVNQSRLLDRLEEEEQTESETKSYDDLRGDYFKNYDKFHADADRLGQKPDGGYPSTSSETRHSGEEVTGYGHSFFRQSVNHSESGSYREHSAQQHHYFHQYQHTGHKNTGKHSCALCNTG